MIRLTFGVTNNSKNFTRAAGAYKVGDLLILADATKGSIVMEIATLTAGVGGTFSQNYTGTTSASVNGDVLPVSSIDPAGDTVLKTQLVQQIVDAMAADQRNAANWGQVLSNTQTEVTVTLPDGSTLTGSSWGYISTKLKDATTFGYSLLNSADAAAGRTALGATATGSALMTSANAAAGRTTLGLGTAATKNTGQNTNDIPTIGMLGFGGLSIDVLSANQNNDKQSGAYNCRSTDTNGPFASATTNVFAQTWGADPIWRSELSIAVSVNRMHFRSIRKDQSGATSWVEVRHTGNTTVDGNGFIKNASPVVRVGGSADEDFKMCGAGSANQEARGVTIHHEAVGVYTVVGANGFAKSGWYIETPNDANGNKLRFVEYLEVGTDIVIKTFIPDYSNGRCEAGAPADIPNGRWIDVRLDMPEGDDNKWDESINGIA